MKFKELTIKGDSIEEAMKMDNKKVYTNEVRRRNLKSPELPIETSTYIVFILVLYEHPQDTI